MLAEAARRREPGAEPAARERYEQALTLAEDLGMRPLQAYCHLGLGRLLAREGQSGADEFLTRAAALAREMDMSFWPASAELDPPGRPRRR